MKKYNFIFREGKMNVFFVDLILENYGICDFVFIVDEFSLEGFASPREMSEASKIGFNLCSDKNKINQLEKKFKKNSSNYLKFLDHLDKINFENLSDRQLKNIFKKFCNVSKNNVDIYFLTEPHFFEKVEVKMRDYILKKQNKTSELNKYFIDLTTPLNINSIFNDEEIEWIKLVKRVKSKNVDIEKEVHSHYKKFKPLFYDKEPKYLFQRLKKMLSWDEKRLDKIKSGILNIDKKNKISRNEAIQRLNLSGEVLNLCESVRRTATLRLNLRFFLNIESSGKKILEEIARRNYLALNQIENCLVSEVNLILYGKEINLRKVNKRNNGFVVVKNNKRWVFYTGEKSKKIIKKVKPIIKRKITSISGSVANMGKIKGAVRILKNIDSDLGLKIGKMKRGDILVTEMTRPQLIGACKKASAIITDEGGINCHASIISRELKIPCVVGTKIATQVLNDGDFVEVDADNGLVKILKK